MLADHAILALETIADLDVAETLHAIGTLTDYANDHAAPDVAQRALRFADDLTTRPLDPEQGALLDYFRANAWACLYAQRLADRAAAWSWDQPEIQAQIFHLRRAMRSEGFSALGPGRQCQVLTNLANQFDTVGRFVEAQEYWTRALAIEPRFWMARGNRGRGLMHYAAALYDAGHGAMLAQRAHGDLLAAFITANQYPELGDPAAPRQFAAWAAEIGRAYDVDAIEGAYDPEASALRSGEEGAYRRWCLANRLFLNPLNDTWEKPIAAHDVLSLPDFATALDEPPVVIGFFNQLKQEFVSARWLFYNGVEAREPHPSDRDVLLVNTLDYPAYGLATEQLKLAFRMSYSLFDKIAYFLNHYLQLGIPSTRVSFRSLWREKDGAPVRDRFERSENWPLRGLYWISKDLFEPGVREVAEPDAEALLDLRNHLEHKYVKVFDWALPRPPAEDEPRDPFYDTLAYGITRADLERKALRVVKLARSALICLALGMHQEEARRRASAAPDKLRMPMSLGEVSDDWKR